MDGESKKERRARRALAKQQRATQQAGGPADMVTKSQSSPNLVRHEVFEQGIAAIGDLPH